MNCEVDMTLSLLKIPGTPSTKLPEDKDVNVLELTILKQA